MRAPTTFGVAHRCHGASGSQRSLYQPPLSRSDGGAVPPSARSVYPLAK